MINYKKLILPLVFLGLISLIGCPKKKNRPPEKPDRPNGPATTYTNKPEVFRTKATDPDGDNMRFVFSWGDGVVDTTSAEELYASGQEAFGVHAWTNPGTYYIKVKAIDEKDSSSVWSDSTAITVSYNARPWLDSFVGPGPSPYVTLPNRYIKFTIAASDSTDSVYVRLVYRKKRVSRYTERPWIGPRPSGSVFRDSITFTVNDTFIVRAIAKDAKGTQSDSSEIYQIIVTGPLWKFMTILPPTGGEPPDTTDYEFTSSPALLQDANGNWRIVVGAIDGCVYCINPVNGARVWRTKSVTTQDDPWAECYFNSTPAVNQTLGHIYIGSEEGELYCISSAGTIKWRWPGNGIDDLTYDEFGSSAAITASGNRIYIGCDDYRLYCIQDNVTRGDTIWSFYTGSEIPSSPALDAQGNIYFGDDSGYVTSLTPNRTVRWRRKIGISVWTSPAISGNRVYIGTDDGYLYALNIDNGNTIWRFTADEGIRSSPVIGTDGAIYFGCNDGKLYALTTAGNLKSGFPILLSDDAITSTPAVATDGTIIIYTTDDIVYGVSPTGRILWRVPLFGSTTSKRLKSRLFEAFQPSPTIGPDGTIYVGSSIAGVYAIRGQSGNSLANTDWPKFRHDIRNTGRVGGSK
ncbi:MAG: PQQ-binding-like beta-propeller repeat protein [candidate division WOR-3 bacterium]|nr:PQQ-binding-like beta-propeller repeat protein [candidate division WOR-3 bacterium]MCX7757208.1 PQQ-binding-like beta-propeller repeat protein [candidate division WOR-3 bacterium]MDW7987934.1 PQQ-binding-like beta-propeller repeat protein [candidate division WOR-3 bacterium]